MKVLIDIGHPAHVHLFKHFAWEIQKKGHEIFFTCREKEFEIYLLEKYGFRYKSFGRKYISKAGKLWGMIEFDVKEFFTGLKFKPDILLSHGSIYAAHAALLLGKPHISFEDTFNFEQIKLYKPFTKAILTGDYPHPCLGKNEVRFAGYHELAYLHPKRFEPDETKIKKYQISIPYVIIRFVAWQATHDRKHNGIGIDMKLKICEELSKYSQVIISSEKELPVEFKIYLQNIAPEDMHDLMAKASLIFSESATMVSEGAVLGVPGIYLDNTGRYYTKEQEEKYGMVYNFSESFEDQKKALKKAIELLTKNSIQEAWSYRRQKMLSEKIDVTAFLVWFVENYPESARIMREEPEWQWRFK